MPRLFPISAGIILTITSAASAFGPQNKMEMDELLAPAETGTLGVPQWNPTRVQTDGIVDVLFVYSGRPGTPAQKQQRLQAVTAGAERVIREFQTSLQYPGSGLQPPLTLRLLGPVELIGAVPDNVEPALKNTEILSQRTAHGADLVVALTAQARGRNEDIAGVTYPYCLNAEAARNGAWLSVITENQLTEPTAGGRHNIYTVPHELGHNFGAGHHLDDQPLDNCAYGDTSYGYSMLIFEDGRWSHYGTMMSYLGARQLIFSNPDVMFRGVPAGSQHANNARAIRHSYRIISNYNESNNPAAQFRQGVNEGPTFADITAPQDGARMRKGDLITVRMRLADVDGVASGEVVWQAPGKRAEVLICPKQWDRQRPPRSGGRTEYTCERADDIFTWTIPLTSSDVGDVTYMLRGFDIFGTYSVQPSRKLTVAR